MKRVLVVDDVEDNIYYLRVLLEAHGFVVESARNGAEALAKARATRPDLVISDLLMPVMDGYTLLWHWKADPRLRRVPFIVYTATYTDPEDERLALSLGADAFVLKPSEPEHFLAVLREVQIKVTAGAASLPRAPVGEESALLKRYGEALIRKLEDKMLELEESNCALKHDQRELQLRDRAIRAVSQGIVIADALLPDLPIIYASPSFERLTGYSAEEIVGKNCRLLQGPDTEPAMIARMRHAIVERCSCSVELLNYRKDGSTFWNDVTISPVADGSGQVTHYVGVQTDVTERRHLESQLRKAQKMEAVGQLAAGVAHDFNNLLSVILSYTMLVLDEMKPGERLRDDIEEVRRAGERATDLTRQLLAFSRQQVLEPLVLDLSQIVLGTEKMLRRLVGEDIELALLPARTAARVHADPTQLEQIIVNLAVNARDAMLAGGKLTIETVCLELDDKYIAENHGVEPGPYVMLAVTDTGIGMDSATRERIFEPFFTTKDKGRGTGLGLSIVFGIVQQSHGHISVHSEVGRGSTFKVYLPRSDRAVDLVISHAPEPGNLRGSETILLVEDEEQVRVLTRTILRRHGYNVLDAQNAGEAFLICEQHNARIQLLLSDVVMPRMGGRQLAERLIGLRPDLKVLFMSGYAENTAFHRGMLESGIAFLQKPIRPNALLRKVRQVLDERRDESVSVEGAS